MAHNMKIIVHTICRLEKVCTVSLFAPTPVTKPYSSKRRAVHSTIPSLSTAINEIGLWVVSRQRKPDNNSRSISKIEIIIQSDKLLSGIFIFFLPYTITCISRYCDISLSLWKSIEELFRSIFIYRIMHQSFIRFTHRQTTIVLIINRLRFYSRDEMPPIRLYFRFLLIISNLTSDV